MISSGAVSGDKSHLDSSSLRVDSWTALFDGEPLPLPGQTSHADLRAIDLFSATGGFMLGARYFCADHKLNLASLAAVDVDGEALAIHRSNHGTEELLPQSVDSLVDFRVRRSQDTATFAYPPELVGPATHMSAKAVDLVLAGPPCQGHSNLNNHTRRDDRRNFYYLSAAAFAVAVDARSVVIENVPAVTRDRAGVVETARTLLEASGYAVEEDVLAADKMGWPQTRKRHFLVARRSTPPIPLARVAAAFAVDRPMWVSTAIGRRQRLSHDTVLHEPTKATAEIQARIDQLFKDKKYELDDEYRPPSHVDGHTYSASYGRMRRDKPAPTITTGFTTPGRGRFVHYAQPRTITPAEAARLQGFPDSYKWRPTPNSDPPTRTQLAKWIGDAVPLPLGYAAAMSALGPDLMDNPPKAADRDSKAA